MPNNGHFIPRQKRAATQFGASVHRVLSAANYDPATAGLDDSDVTEFGDLVAANQAALDQVDSLNQALRRATKALSGPKGTHRKMVAKLRYIANKARVSTASNAQLAKLDIQRRTLRGSRRNAPKDAPEFTVGHAIPGVINVRFRELGSANPRAKAANAIGVHIAVVDAAQRVARGEADRAPIKAVSRSPAKLDTTGWPARVRLYARWVTQRGESSPWSGAQWVTVMV